VKYPCIPLVFFFSIALLCEADCWKNVQPGQHSAELNCLYLDWEKNPGRQNLTRLIQTLFYVYISESQNPAMRRFFDGMRAARFEEALLLREELIRRYTFDEPASPETASLWAMPAYDARILFVLSQTDRSTIPFAISCAMHLTIYEEIERYFSLNSFRRRCNINDHIFAVILDVKQLSSVLRPLRATATVTGELPSSSGSGKRLYIEFSLSRLFRSERKPASIG
jgi:hypothetical protein